MTLLLVVIVVALAFEFINGFHDTANSIATVVSTKVLTPRRAIALAAVSNFAGALWGTAVAKTIASGIVDPAIVTSSVLIAALCGAIFWNLLTWWFGLPSSSSHALIGGLCGAAVAATGDPGVVIWSAQSGTSWLSNSGVLWKVVLPMMLSPCLGFVLGALVMAILYAALSRARPAGVGAAFGRLQIISATAMGFMHGTNDAQKTMGIITLALISAAAAGATVDLPRELSFLYLDPSAGREVPLWVKVICAVVMAAGTAMGGWRIIKTLGHKLVRLQPINGFAAETSSSAVIFAATSLGIPVSTTHNITAAILGVGAAKNLASVRWHVVEQILWAWLLTLPCSAAFSYGLALAITPR
jgi:PiT family inorganic phosphate transporter